MSKKDHKEAVVWFDKAMPLFQKAADDLPAHDVGRLGETLVSMGVSYWEVGDQDRGLEYTQTGVELIEASVEAGYVETSILEVPYSNLANMHRQLGETSEAEKYSRMASQSDSTIR